MTILIINEDMMMMIQRSTEKFKSFVNMRSYEIPRTDSFEWTDD